MDISSFLIAQRQASTSNLFHREEYIPPSPPTSSKIYWGVVGPRHNITKIQITYQNPSFPHHQLSNLQILNPFHHKRFCKYFFLSPIALCSWSTGCLERSVTTKGCGTDYYYHQTSVPIAQSLSSDPPLSLSRPAGVLCCLYVLFFWEKGGIAASLQRKGKHSSTAQAAADLRFSKEPATTSLAACSHPPFFLGAVRAPSTPVSLPSRLPACFRLQLVWCCFNARRRREELSSTSLIALESEVVGAGRKKEEGGG